MNMIVTKLAMDEPRFKGKISIVAHSLGTVITYDLLTRQKWENFRMGEAVINERDEFMDENDDQEEEDIFAKAIEKIRSGQGKQYHSAAEAVVLHQDNLADKFLRPSLPSREAFAKNIDP